MAVKKPYFKRKKSKPLKIRLSTGMHLIGIEPTHAAPEATALSTELQMHLSYSTIFSYELQDYFYLSLIHI